MNSPNPIVPSDESGDAIRPHTFDGIQEYDKRLPNWWLNTLYGAIVFSVVWWFVYQVARVVPSDGEQVDAAMAKIAAAKMTSSFDPNDDGKFWEMSKNAEFVAAGKQTFVSLCVACHAANLTGGVGPNLADRAWLHGGTPQEIYRTVINGVPAKGMLAWGPVLGANKSAEVVAYVLSHHTAGEPIEVQASFTPGVPAQ